VYLGKTALEHPSAEKKWRHCWLFTLRHPRMCPVAFKRQSMGAEGFESGAKLALTYANA